MKASTCNRGSIDVRIHNQQIQKHILGSKKKMGGWEGEGGGCFHNEIMNAEKSGVQSSFAKTVRQIVVKEWPVSRH